MGNVGAGENACTSIDLQRNENITLETLAGALSRASVGGWVGEEDAIGVDERGARVLDIRGCVRITASANGGGARLGRRRVPRRLTAQILPWC